MLSLPIALTVFAGTTATLPSPPQWRPIESFDVSTMPEISSEPDELTKDAAWSSETAAETARTALRSAQLATTLVKHGIASVRTPSPVSMVDEVGRVAAVGGDLPVAASIAQHTDSLLGKIPRIGKILLVGAAGAVGGLLTGFFKDEDRSSPDRTSPAIGGEVSLKAPISR